MAAVIDSASREPAAGPSLAVIPAAGRGSRFLPVSRVVAKELLPLGRKPLIHHALDEVERAGFTRVVIVTSPAKRQLRSYFEADPALERELLERGDVEALGRVPAAVATASPPPRSLV